MSINHTEAAKRLAEQKYPRPDLTPTKAERSGVLPRREDWDWQKRYGYASAMEEVLPLLEEAKRYSQHALECRGVLFINANGIPEMDARNGCDCGLGAFLDKINKLLA